MKKLFVVMLSAALLLCGTFNAAAEDLDTPIDEVIIEEYTKYIFKNDDFIQKGNLHFKSNWYQRNSNYDNLQPNTAKEKWK